MRVLAMTAEWCFESGVGPKALTQRFALIGDLWSFSKNFLRQLDVAFSAFGPDIVKKYRLPWLGLPRGGRCGVSRF